MKSRLVLAHVNYLHHVTFSGTLAVQDSCIFLVIYQYHEDMVEMHLDVVDEQSVQKKSICMQCIMLSGKGNTSLMIYIMDSIFRCHSIAPITSKLSQ